MAITDATDFPLFVLISSFFAIFLILALALYFYLSFAYMAVGKKAKINSSGLAWVPFIGPNLIAFQSSKMSAWPWFLLIGYFIPFLNFICMAVFGIFTVIWHWKMFERIGRPNWWAILMLVPVVNLIVIGIAAWSK